jgi:sigma-B regulation protein RsbU (phosphoserine phosphatase)
MDQDTPTILIVDDDEDIRSLLTDRLEYSGYRVITAENGEIGLERIREDQPDLVLLDILMPRLDGFGVLKGLEQEGLSPTVVMITAHGTVQTAVQAMQQGAFDFMLKPFQPQDVERHVTRALERTRLQKENERLQRELAAAQSLLIDEMRGELQAAHDMQMGLLPPAPPETDCLEISGICIPAKQVGGDYYAYLDYLSDDGSKFGIVTADVSGKGMPAATIATRFHEILLYEARDRTSGVDILKGLDRSLRGRIPPEMFVTCGIGIIDCPSQTLTFSSAANPEVYHYVASEGQTRSLGVTGYPIGMSFEFEGADPFNSVTVDLRPGDAMAFTSDGVEEARNTEDDFYGGDRLAALLQSGGQRGAAADTIRNDIIADVVDFMAGSDQMDDITVVVLRVTGRAHT